MSNRVSDSRGVYVNTIKSLLIASAVLASTVIAGGVVNAQTANSPLCTRTGIPLSEYGGKNFTVSGDKISVKFKVTGAANCKYDVTLATFKGYKKTAPAPGFDKFYSFDIPREYQKLYSSTTKTVTGPGVHTLETTVPACIWQADVFTGKAKSSVAGTPYLTYATKSNFTNLGNAYASTTDTAHVHDAHFGGNSVCEDPKPVEPCPYDSTMKKGDPDCKQPVTPVKPITPVTPTPVVQPAPTKDAPVSTLPSTGAASALAGTLGVGTTTGLLYKFVESKRKLKSLFR